MRCIIGVHAWERQVTQRLLVDLELVIDAGAAAATDALHETIDYAAVCAAVSRIAREGRFRLIETLAVRAAEALVAETAASRVTVSVRKPGAVREADSVGVRVMRP